VHANFFTVVYEYHAGQGKLHKRCAASGFVDQAGSGAVLIVIAKRIAGHTLYMMQLKRVVECAQKPSPLTSFPAHN